MSLSLLRLCLCSASFLACGVPVSCLRLAVSLGLCLRAPPLKSRPEDPCSPSPPAWDRTSCPHGRAFPGLRVTRRGSDSGGHPSGLPMLQVLLEGRPPQHTPDSLAPPPLAPGPLLSPRMLRRLAARRLCACPGPLRARPAGAPGGQLAESLSGGGAARARAQKGRLPVARLAEEKAVWPAEVGSRPAPREEMNVFDAGETGMIWSFTRTH